MAIINIKASENDVININTGHQQVEVEKKSINELYETLRTMLLKYNNKRCLEKHKAWWYEVFADFCEDFDETIYPIIKGMDVKSAFTYCLGYMYRQDDYYDSPQWLKDLDDMIKDCDFKTF